MLSIEFSSGTDAEIDRLAAILVEEGDELLQRYRRLCGLSALQRFRQLEAQLAQATPAKAEPVVAPVAETNGKSLNGEMTGDLWVSSAATPW